MRHGKKIASGIFGTVYDFDGNKVLRKSHDETDGWRALLWLTDKDREIFNLPVIHHFDEEENEWAVVERLYPVGSALFQDMGESDWRWLNNNRVILNEKQDPRLIELFKSAIALFEYITSKEFPIRELDLHDRNIMQRDDGTLVISDPFGQLDI